MKYYRLIEDVYYPERWYLGDILGVDDNWQFVNGEIVEEKLLSENLSIALWKNGKPMDYTTNEVYSVPIISDRLRNQLGGLQGARFIPVTIDGHEDLKYFIMVATDKIACVDEQHSVFEKFVENDPIRPDLAGHYSWFSKLKIDPSKVNNKDIFRIEKSETKLIVSERVKAAMEDIGATGTEFIEA